MKGYSNYWRKANGRTFTIHIIMIKKTGIVFSVAITVLLTILLLLYNLEFDDSITYEDIKYSNLITTNFSIDTTTRFRSYADEVVFIKQIQNAVNRFSIIGDGIPMCHERNIKDLYTTKMGLCYDKSHVIEKILRVYGFDTRHISIYYYENLIQLIFAVINPYTQSHAVSEVKTRKGWILVDSLSEIIGLDSNNDPISLGKLREMIERGAANEDIASNINYDKKFIFFYGIYSRNGKLYPPYNSIPDFRFCELKYNFLPK